MKVHKIPQCIGSFFGISFANEEFDRVAGKHTVTSSSGKEYEFNI